MIEIVRVWHQNDEIGRRIHYVIKRADGSQRHLYADRGSALYEVLDEHLAAAASAR